MSTPLDVAALRARLAGRYAKLDVVASTGSTNADLRGATQDRTVLVAEEQTAGQGRRGRSWKSPDGGLYLSALFRPDGVPAHRLPWLTLLAGVALVRTAASVGVKAELKWPNDLLVAGRKAAGVLAEITPDHGVIVGIGLNVAELPPDVEPGAGGLRPTSLQEHAAEPLDRAEVAGTLLDELAALEQDWRAAGGDPGSTGLLDEYRAHCGTLGRSVRVELSGSHSSGSHSSGSHSSGSHSSGGRSSGGQLAGSRSSGARPSGSQLSGTALSVEVDGTLVVRDEAGVSHTVSAGDVVHLRVR
ncbi:BirA family biotin operon repressor/biotin-[acetyl-CoA-carboxylase] ligase [Saccharothrix tamanrassetensis]|uniref:BirA family biotin operon repressor/biotin-[acetyl-CoA-carboxylase] ligase n=1 Tax=Saccharothrix tamanrassetensis TaxID=1051531 RepID=A0A841CG00_9PSEU|nr:biotin--[acetyl-CoA-carboxylase] ligase [Saccharothrix tamanrassetensis]MBB5955108.1 BirA family biotin operon repressor/biotin-[acetyl-CoA-carboxylase] ligase [Saccharothrix tamanrassetensis]